MEQNTVETGEKEMDAGPLRSPLELIVKTLNKTQINERVLISHPEAAECSGSDNLVHTDSIF